MLLAARHAVKSYYYHNYGIAPYSLHTSAMVDGTKWFTVNCNREISAWIKSQSKDMFYEHVSININWNTHKTAFDIHEKIYTMLQLKYGHDRV